MAVEYIYSLDVIVCTRVTRTSEIVKMTKIRTRVINFCDIVYNTTFEISYNQICVRCRLYGVHTIERFLFIIFLPDLTDECFITIKYNDMYTCACVFNINRSYQIRI